MNSGVEAFQISESGWWAHRRLSTQESIFVPRAKKGRRLHGAPDWEGNPMTLLPDQFTSRQPDKTQPKSDQPEGGRFGSICTPLEGVYRNPAGAAGRSATGSQSC